MKTTLRLVMVGLALLAGGWMMFDGTRALVVGDFITPSSGAYAGQLGPWAQVVEAVGIPARSTAMKTTFVTLGLVWLVAAYGLARRRDWAFALSLGIAVATLWYLPVGTIVSVIILIAGAVLRTRLRRDRVFAR